MKMPGKNRVIWGLVCTLLLSTAVFPSTALAAEPEEEYAGWLIQLKNPAEVPAAAGAVTGDMAPVDYTDGLYLAGTPQSAAGLVERGLVEYIEPNYVLTLLEEYTAGDWSTQAIQAESVWNHTDADGNYDARGDGVIVAVIDSGVSSVQTDLNQSNIIRTVDPQFDDCIGNHGTAVAGILAAQLNGDGTDGVAPNVTLLPLCVAYEVNKQTKVSTARVVSAINYAVDREADVINLSFGGTSASGMASVEIACRNAITAGVIVVAAAGNYTSGQTKSSRVLCYPASYDGVISVSACKQDPNGGPPQFAEEYSFFNDRITVCAPGSSISVLAYEGQAYDSGTSFAAPVVSGLAAVARQLCPGLTAEAFTRLLSVSCTDCGEPGPDMYYGYGVVNAEQLLTVLLDGSVQISEHEVQLYIGTGRQQGYLAAYDGGRLTACYSALWQSGVYTFTVEETVGDYDWRLFFLDGSCVPTDAPRIIA